MISLLDHHIPYRRRRGFTLLELIIAVVLMSILMMATWNLLDIYRNQFERNQVRVERWQLVRSLNDQLARDLRSCSVRRQDQTAQTTDLAFAPDQPVGVPFSDPDPLLLSDGSDEPALPSTDWLRSVVGLEGTSSSLTLDVIASKPVHVPSQSMDPNRPSIPDSIRRVVYLFSSPSTATRSGRPPGLIRCEWTAEELLAISTLESAESDMCEVLRRLRVPGLPIQDPPLQSTATGPDVAGPASGQFQESIGGDVEQRVDYVPELKAFRLRYFDGQVWSDRWSAEQQGTLPVAVELHLELTDPFWLQPEPANADAPRELATSLLSEDEPSELVVDDERLRSSQLEAPKGFRRLIYLGRLPG